MLTIIEAHTGRVAWKAGHVWVAHMMMSKIYLVFGW